MAPAAPLRVLLLLLVAHRALCQNPFIPVTNTCSTRRCREPTKFQYKPGQAYHYRYEANTASSVLGVSSRSTTLTLQCDVTLHVITPCEHSLTIEDVRLHTVAVDQGSLTDKDIQSDAFTSPLESFKLRFGFQDGVIDSVCPEEGDPTWSVNIKKGIASALQNSQDRFDLNFMDVERDVTGDCPTTYRVEGVDERGLVISKERDLNACVARFAHTSHIQGVSYNIKSPVQNIPLVWSSSACHQTVHSGQLTSVTCDERHQLKPFSHDQSGAVTVTAQNLTLIDVFEATVSQDLVKQRENLLYNHMPAKSASHTRENSLTEAETLVKNLCEDDSEVRVESTTQFSQLIDDLRGMSLTEISALYRLSPDICRHGQQLIKDALPVVSTPASLELMRELILDGKVPPEVANTWLLALNFIPSVDQAMLRTVGGLLEARQPAVVTRALLSVGAVLHQYCRQHDNCHTDGVALDIAHRLARPLGHDCATQSVDREKKVLLTLRAVGNAGMSPPGIVNVLTECFMNRDNPVRIKVAAIEAFRRTSCAMHRDEMRSVFLDLQEDSEVRIAAYLGLMRCPTHTVIGVIGNALEREQVNQVGSFVWTHLTNLRETSSPYQLEVQGLLADFSLQKKFSTDVRKFSRNFEISGFNSEYHIGTSLDSNLVYSSRSYVPRSFSSNLTLQLFGESVNLVEVGARVEGMERLVESMFGPGGVLHKAAPGPLFRDRRDTKRSQLEAIKADFDAESRFGGPLVSFNVKVFGHEVDNIDLRGSDMQELATWMSKSGPGELLTRLSSTESLDISRSVKFLEGTYIVPTGTGLPLNVTASAVAAVNIQMSGNVHLDKLIRDQQLDLAFRLRPSGAITFDGTMMVDGMAVQLGLGMKATVHSSTLIDASLQMDGYKVVDARVNMPKERMDLYNFESSLRFVHQDKQTALTSEITMEGNRHEQVSLNACTGGERIKGWRTCVYLTYVNASENTLAPHFPLTGPTKMGYYLDKTDKTMEGYRLEWKLSENRFDHNVKLVFDTPGSTIDRKVELNLKRSKKHGRIGFRLRYPGDEITGKGETSWDPNKKGLKVEITRKGVQVLSLNSQLVTQRTGAATLHRPTFILTFLKNPYANLRGYIKLVDNEGLRSREIELTLVTPVITLGLSSQAVRTRDLYNSSIVLKHSTEGRPERELSLRLEDQEIEDGDGGRVGHWMATIDWDISETIHPAWAVRWDYKNAQAGSMNSMQTAARPEDFDVRRTFAAGYAFDFIATEESSKMRGRVELLYPAAGVDLLLAAEHEALYQGLKNNITLRYASGRELRSLLTVNGLPVSRTRQVEASWQLSVPGYRQPLALRGTVRQMPRAEPHAPQAYGFRLQGTWLTGGTAVAVGQYQMQRDMRNSLVDRSASFNLTVDQRLMLAAHFRLALSPAQATVELKVDRGESEYGIDIQYDVTRAVLDVQRSVRLAVTYPGSHYSCAASLRLGREFRTTLELSLDTQRDIQLLLSGTRSQSLLEWVVDVKWDANRDPTQRVRVDFHAEQAQPQHRNVTVLLVYPVNTVQLTMDRTMTGGPHRLQYDNRMVLAFGASAPLEVTVSVTTQLDRPTKLVSVDVAASSPFPQWRSNSLKLRHSRSARELTSQLEASAGGEQITMTVAGDNRLPASLRVSAELTSSLRRWSRLRASLLHRATYGRISSELDLETPSGRLTADLGLHDLSTANQRQYRAELNATTPFQGLHELSYVLNGQLSGGEVLIVGESRVENIGHNLLITGRGGDRQERLEGSLTLHQIHPQQNLLTAELLVDPTEKGRAFKTSLEWPDNRLALEGDMHFATAQDFGIGLQFLSPFDAVRDAGLMLKHKRIGWKVQSEARVAWLLDNPLALMLDTDLKEISAFHLFTELSLPMEGWSPLSAGLRSKHSPDTHTISAGVEAALAEYKFALTADGSLGRHTEPTDKRYGTVSITLPVGPVDRLLVAASLLSASPVTYEAFFSPVWKLRHGALQEIRLTGLLNVDSMPEVAPRAVQAHLRLLSPWHDMLFLELSHRPVAPLHRFVTKLAGSLGSHNLRIITSVIDLPSGMRVVLNSTSNVRQLPAFDSVTTVIMRPQFRLDSALWTPREYRLKLGADLASPARRVFNAEIHTPVAWMDHVSADLEVAGDYRERAVNATITLPGYGRHIRLIGTVKPADVRFTFSTPYSHFRSGAVQMSVAAAAGRLNPVFRITWDRHIVELKGTAVTQGDNLPSQVTGTLTINLPVGPRVNASFQLNARREPGQSDLVYDLTVTSSVDHQNYQLEGEILSGPRRFGVILETVSSDSRLQMSGSFVISLDVVPGLKSVQFELEVPHQPLANISANMEYRVGQEGRQVSVKLRHPKLFIETASRVTLLSWRQFHLSTEGKLKIGSAVMHRAVRVYFEPVPTPTGMLKSELGAAWHLSAPDALSGWGRYHVVADYQLRPAGFNASLLAGGGAWRDHTAPTDLRTGLDVHFNRAATMARGVLTVHLGDGVYTVDTDYLVRQSYSGGVRVTQRSPGTDWQVAARGALTPAPDHWRVVVNLTLPVDGYKNVDADVVITPAPGVYGLSATVDVDPMSSFYQHTSHRLQLTADVTSLPAVAGNFSYLHRDLDDAVDLSKVTGRLTTTYSSHEMGANLQGELLDDTYTLVVLRSVQDRGKTGKLHLTTSFPSLEDFLAEYEFEAGGEHAVRTTFGSVYNQKSLVDGTYTLTLADDGTQRHTLDLKNPLQPFNAEMTYAATAAQRRVDVRATSLLDSSMSITGWAELSYTADGREVLLNVTLPWRSVAMRHSVERRGALYQRAARLTFSPEAFVGYKLDVEQGTDVRDEAGGSARLQLDFPARSVAGSVLVGATRSRRSSMFGSARTRVHFLWDAERQPERQVGATFKVSDLSTADQLYYNLTIGVDIAGKPASLETSVRRSAREPLQLKAVFAYSADPDSHLTLSYGVANHTRSRKSVLKSTLFLSHPISRLSVTGKGQLEKAPGLWKLSGSYTYLDIEDRTLKSSVLLNLDKKLGEFQAQVSMPSIIYELKSNTGLTDYRINGAAIPVEFGSPQTVSIKIQRDRPLVLAEVLYDPEQAKRLYVGGGMMNNRTFRLEAYRQSGSYRVDDAVVFLRLNHSHLLTSQARWRSELADELTSWIQSAAEATREAILEVTSKEWEVKMGAMESSLEEVFGQELDMIVEDFTSVSTGSVRGDYEDIRYALTESHENNEFYMQTILSYIYGSEGSLVNSLLNQLDVWTERLLDDLELISDSVYEKINNLIEYLRSLVSASRDGQRSVTDTLREVLAEVADAYDKWVWDLYARASLRLRQVYLTVTGYVRHRLLEVANMYQPHLLMFYHYLESNVFQVVRNAFSWFYGEFRQSDLYTAVQWLHKTLDKLFKDIRERDVVTNVFDYAKKIISWPYTTFGLEDVLGEPGLWLKNQWENPPLALAGTKKIIMVCYYKVSWVFNHLGVLEKIQNIVSKIYADGDKFWTQTAIEGAQRYFEGKSIMVMRPDQGYISWIQVLPMPWYGLNQRPVWQELPELKRIKWLRDLTKSSDWTFYNTVWEYWPGQNPVDWVPPFKGHAVLSGSSSFVTFDGKLYTFQSDCTYLLAADLLADRFFIEATFKRRGPIRKTITVTAGEHTIQLGGPDGFQITADNRPADAPLAVGELIAIRSGDVITVSLPGWMELRCNQRSDVCALELTGWLFGRTGGLFGTLDNEPYTDVQTRTHHPTSLPLFAASWALTRCTARASFSQPAVVPADALSSRTAAPGKDGFCWGLLAAPHSDYSPCHRLLDPAPFLAACQAQQAEQRCVAVRAYVEACQHLGWPLKMPNKCVQCTIQGKSVFEGKTVRVQSDVPATEVVFIVEAKSCNANVTVNRSLKRVLIGLHHSLRKEGFATTRYAVVAFGGDGVQNEPHALTVDGKIFSSYKKIVGALDRIKPGSGNKDVFGALRKAAHLPFSPGVSRTFILLPCSPCWSNGMSIDYTTLANAFAEQQITLHIMLNDQFSVSKKKNKLLGIDRTKAWTVKDAKNFVGDGALLKHVKSPKASLGLCEPLARKQTQGSIFSVSKLQPRHNEVTGRLQIKMRPLKKWVVVFGRRVALTARPHRCQTCECATNVEDTVRPVCVPCSSDLPLLMEDDVFWEDD